MASNPVLKIEVTLKDRVINAYTFDQEAVVIGRDPEADIPIDNTGISRYHSKIELNAGGTYILKDLGSTNGTYLNDQRINEEPLRTNDIITIGKFILKVSVLKHDAAPRDARHQPAADDIDGTTVLSKEQMEKMMAGIKKNPPAQSPSAAAPKSAQPGISLGVLAAIGGVVFVAVLAIAWFLIM